MTRDWKQYVGIALTGAILAMAGFLLFYHLGLEPLQDYDEATYAAVTQEMQTSGNMFSLKLFGQDYFRKPPLLFWLMTASEQVIPDIETAARVPSALAAFFLVALVMLLAYEATGSLFAAAFSGAALATMGGFAEAARQVRFDSLVALFDVLALYAFIRGLRDRRWYLLVGVALGLAVLAKGILVIFAGVAIMAVAIAARRFDWLKDGYFWGGIALGLLIALPWHVYETMQYGMHFWHEYFGTQVVDRVQQDLFGKGPSNLDYLGYLGSFSAPWAFTWCLSLVAAPFLYVRASAQTRALFIASVVTVLSILIVLFVSKTKAYTYLMPLYPFIALGIGLIGGELWKRWSNMLPRLALAFIVLAATGSGAWLALIYGTHADPIYAGIVTHAREEYAATKAIQAYAPTGKLYEYGDNDIGSIQFYSGIHPVYGYYSDSPIQGTVFILLKPEDRALLNKVQPYRKLTDIYSGTFVDVVSTGAD